MIRSKIFLVLSLLILCLLIIRSPGFITIQGVAPCWAILWLIPWSLKFGSINGSLAGLCFGLFIDSIALIDATHIPALMIIGFYCGRLGKKNIPIELTLNFALLAWIGSVFLGISLWIQILLKNYSVLGMLINSWVYSTVLAQSIITSMLAPIVCSWVNLLLRKSNI